MSENNNPDLTITEAELLSAEPYDFEFIASTLGLIPYQALDLDNQSSFQGALNPGAIVNLEVTEEGHVAITLHGGEEILMGVDHLAEFEQTLRERIEDSKTKAKENFKDQLRMQNEAMAELNSGIQPGIIGGSPGRRGRFTH